MKSGYDQFFKNARKAAPQGKPVSSSKLKISEADIEQQLKMHLGMPTIKNKKKKRKSIPWKLMALSFAGVMATAWGFQNLDLVESTLKRVEFSYLGNAMAETKSAETKKAPAKDNAEAKKVGADGKPSVENAGEKTAGTTVAPTGDDAIDHLSKLNDRKKELDEKEEELGRMEQELTAQKEELDKRLKDLEGMRRGISSVLEEKVKVDDKKLDTLVSIYSDMKAPQAAKVFETMDEDLAVGILGRMKKKNAADIMTLLKADKAQALTEKFAGYKRK